MYMYNKCIIIQKNPTKICGCCKQELKDLKQVGEYKIDPVDDFGRRRKKRKQ